MSRCPQCNQFHTTQGYRNCTINVYPSQPRNVNQYFWYKITMTNGEEFIKRGFLRLEAAFEAAMEKIDEIKPRRK